MLAATLANCPAVYLVWVVLTLLVFPLYSFSAKELAPTEDQGVVFGKVRAGQRDDGAADAKH